MMRSLSGPPSQALLWSSGLSAALTVFIGTSMKAVCVPSFWDPKVQDDGQQEVDPGVPPKPSPGFLAGDFGHWQMGIRW